MTSAIQLCPLSLFPILRILPATAPPTVPLILRIERDEDMCGIFCALSKHRHIFSGPQLGTLLQNRGPDSRGHIETVVDLESLTTHPDDYGRSSSRIYATFESTLLSLRGDRTVSQPYQASSSTSILCWNGEAWSIGGLPTAGNDTKAIYEVLVMVNTATPAVAHTVEEAVDGIAVVARHLSTVAGPYAFVLFDKPNRRLYLGRDFLGRRSLLLRTTDDGEVLLSSVSNGSGAEKWTELEADGVYCIDLALKVPEAPPSAVHVEQWGGFTVLKVPYQFHNDNLADGPVSVIPRLSLNGDISSNTPLLTSMSSSVSHLEQLLRASLAFRVLDIPHPPFQPSDKPQHPRAKLAILFSGGLDCTVLARLTHDLLPADEPIDLLNVAFENPRIHGPNTTSSPYELCPDRITARSSHSELYRICPDRVWRLVTIDVAYRETLEHRERVVQLMHPHNTEMDLSICYALYFAARGHGHTTLPNDAEIVPYTTPARVMLSGLGADELFGGYQRHATAFSRRGHTGLINELQLDVVRLGKRNLGRDDRVLANWSREVRLPFLDEEVVGWAVSAEVGEKCGFGEPTIVDQPTSAVNGTDPVAFEAGGKEDVSARLEPGKKVLRCLAWKLGMRGVAGEKKRAIQFGARTAKMETGKSKGTSLLR